MKLIHVPTINARYWTAILCASIFGTNLGDFYAHESGLGIGWGLLVLAALAALTFALEHRDSQPRELWYWLVIITIRTGATNIADWLAFDIRVPQAILVCALAALIAGFGWLAAQGATSDARSNAPLLHTWAAYWLAMLSAGVFGTVLGDVCLHAVGELAASLGLLAVFATALMFRVRTAVSSILTYWLVVAVARTAGTSIGDWIAENNTLSIGLPFATSITGTLFVLVLLFVPSTDHTEVGAA